MPINDINVNAIDQGLTDSTEKLFYAAGYAYGSINMNAAEPIPSADFWPPTFCADRCEATRENTRLWYIGVCDGAGQVTHTDDGSQTMADGYSVMGTWGLAYVEAWQQAIAHGHEPAAAALCAQRVAQAVLDRCTNLGPDEESATARTNRRYRPRCRQQEPAPMGAA